MALSTFQNPKAQYAKAQGALEYLLIIGVALIVVGVVAFGLLNLMNSQNPNDDIGNSPNPLKDELTRARLLSVTKCSENGLPIDFTGVILSKGVKASTASNVWSYDSGLTVSNASTYTACKWGCDTSDTKNFYVLNTDGTKCVLGDPSYVPKVCTGVSPCSTNVSAVCSTAVPSVNTPWTLYTGTLTNPTPSQLPACTWKSNFVCSGVSPCLSDSTKFCSSVSPTTENVSWQQGNGVDACTWTTASCLTPAPCVVGSNKLCLTGTPTLLNQAWAYSETGGACTWKCATDYVKDSSNNCNPLFLHWACLGTSPCLSSTENIVCSPHLASWPMTGWSRGNGVDACTWKYVCPSAPCVSGDNKVCSTLELNSSTNVSSWTYNANGLACTWKCADGYAYDSTTNSCVLNSNISDIYSSLINLTSRWKLNNDLVNSVSGMPSFSPIGATDFADGVESSGFVGTFSKNNGFVFGNQSNALTNRDFSLSFWFKVEPNFRGTLLYFGADLPNNKGMFNNQLKLIVSDDATDTENLGSVLQIEYGGEVCSWDYISCDSLYKNSILPSTDSTYGDWHNVIITSNGFGNYDFWNSSNNIDGIVQLYLDGYFVYNSVIYWGNLNWNNSMILSGKTVKFLGDYSTTNSNDSSAKIDEVAIWNRQLSDGEIALLYNNLKENLVN